MNTMEFIPQLTAQLEQMPSWNLEQVPADAHTLVLAIDLNKGFTRSGALASPRVEAILPDVREFLELCHSKNLLVAAVTDCHSADSLELASYPPHCLEDSAEPELAPEIQEFPQKILTKNSTNAFFAPGMKRLLENVQTVIVVGCCTDICVQQFAVTLKAFANQENRPLSVIVPRQLVETYDAPGHPAEFFQLASLLSMAGNGIEVVNYLPTKNSKES